MRRCALPTARCKLAAADVERLAVAAYLTGHDDEACDTWARAHRQYLRDDDGLGAVRCAFWLGCVLILRGQLAPAHGWFARTQAPRRTGALRTGRVWLSRPGRRAGDAVLRRSAPPLARASRRRHSPVSATPMPTSRAVGRLGCGQALVMTGEVADGLAMLDEAMVAVTAGEVSPVATGLIYCAVIETCQESVRPAPRPGVDACARQLVRRPTRSRAVPRAMPRPPRRADALPRRVDRRPRRSANRPPRDSASRSIRRSAPPSTSRPSCTGCAAMIGPPSDLYRRASDAGHGAQPGLALLRLRQGRADVGRCGDRACPWGASLPCRARHDCSPLVSRSCSPAATSTRPGSPPRAVGLCDAARHATDDRGDVARRDAAPCCSPAATHRPRCARCGRRGRSGRSSRRPTRRPARGCRSAWPAATLGDEDGRGDGVRRRAAAFVEPRRRPGRRAGRRAVGARPPAPGGLTARETRGARLVATGATNRAIAAELVISEKTVARHVSNIFAKLGVSSRAAATAYAYEHELMYVPLLRRITHGTASSGLRTSPDALRRRTSYGRTGPKGDGMTTNAVAQLITNGPRARLLAGTSISRTAHRCSGDLDGADRGRSGPDMVLLHGPGEYAAGWSEVIEAIAATHHVVAPDLPGHGESAADGDLSAELVIAWLDDLIATTCAVPPVVVGRVLGGAIAMRHAIEHGDRVGALVLVDTMGLVGLRTCATVRRSAPSPSRRPHPADAGTTDAVLRARFRRRARAAR